MNIPNKYLFIRFSICDIFIRGRFEFSMILLFNPEWSNGLKLLIADNPLDSPMDTFRILMIVTILEICGSKLNSSTIAAKQQRLDEFGWRRTPRSAA